MTDYREENRRLAELVSEFQTMAARKNSAVGGSLENATVQLLQCTYSLKTATKEDLLKLTGNKRIVDYLLRIFNDEPLEAVLKDVNLTKSGRTRVPDDLQKKIEAEQKKIEAGKIVGTLPVGEYHKYGKTVKALEERRY